MDTGTYLSEEVRERLVEAARLATVGRLVPSFVHQMSTPLAAIALRAESLERSTADPERPSPPEKTLRYLQAMSQETRRCQELMTALRLFAGRAQTAPSSVDLGLVCRGAADLVRDEAMRRQVTLELTLESPLPAVRGFEAQIAQAVLALVLNAVDASSREGKVSVSLCRADGQLELSVADEGSGVAEAARARLFEPFSSSHPPEAGLGLGLMASRIVAEAHGGSVRYESAPQDRGSRFVLRLPLVAPSVPAETR